MRGKYTGPMTMDQLFQALFQDRRIFLDRHAGNVRIRSAYLYINFCDEHGRPVEIRDARGLPIDGYIGSSAYHCAADQYVPGDIEARPVQADAEAKAASTLRRSTLMHFAPH